MIMCEAIRAAIGVSLVVRFDLQALIGSSLADALLCAYPLNADPTKPCFTVGLIGPLIILARAIYAFNVSLAGRRPVEEPRSP